LTPNNGPALEVSGGSRRGPSTAPTGPTSAPPSALLTCAPPPVQAACSAGGRRRGRAGGSSRVLGKARNGAPFRQESLSRIDFRTCWWDIPQPPLPSAPESHRDIARASNRQHPSPPPPPPPPQTYGSTPMASPTPSRLKWRAVRMQSGPAPSRFKSPRGERDILHQRQRPGSLPTAAKMRKGPVDHGPWSSCRVNRGQPRRNVHEALRRPAISGARRRCARSKQAHSVPDVGQCRRSPSGRIGVQPGVGVQEQPARPGSHGRRPRFSLRRHCRARPSIVRRRAAARRSSRPASRLPPGSDHDELGAPSRQRRERIEARLYPSLGFIEHRKR